VDSIKQLFCLTVSISIGYENDFITVRLSNTILFTRIGDNELNRVYHLCYHLVDFVCSICIQVSI
jgi:hypothetical protein